MEDTLKEILNEIKEIKVKNRKFESEQKKLVKQVSDIKTLLTKMLILTFISSEFGTPI